MIRAISARELAERLNGENPPVVVDVREPWEVELASLPGARSIPLGTLMRAHTALDPAAETVLVCHHGMRSMHACMFLEQAGFSTLLNLMGGIDAWSAEVDPATPRY